MGRCIVAWTAIVVLLAVSEALSEPARDGQDNIAKLAPRRSVNRLLRTNGEDDEERGPITEKIFLKLSKLAEKAGKNDLSKKLEHKSWLEGGKGPQYHFQKNGWKGKSGEELMQDPSFIRYFGFDEKWLKALQKKKLIHTTDEWIELWNEQMKKAAS